MLPVESGVMGEWSGIVPSRLDRSREEIADARAVAVAIGPSDARGGRRAVRASPWRRRADQLPDRAAGRRRAARPGDRLAGAPRTPPGAQGAAAVPGRGPGWAGPAQGAWPSGAGPADLAGRAAAGDRPGPARGRRR